ncbi:MAG: hypothetical protein KKE62_13085 [Proteobacteria bacterium]|nr:hypothetical protein [Pseudomonadota bacterium]MBU1389755.1 hypothetical protein [Pseudomonadota bacterium]MBU1543764.1 hypothetical protein [Pseudomonadota bacterium]MBU2480119.1 hypothetical protein [Pseudomonadota bacterium]
MKPNAIIISAVFAVCLAGLGVHLFYKQIRINQFKTRHQAISLKEKTDTQASSAEISAQMLPASPSELPLTLWGTIMGPIDSYAVIEDHQTRSQGLYKPGDMIQNAVIKQVFKDSVILEYNHKDYILKNDLLNTLKPQSITKNSATNTRNIQIKQSAVHALFNRTEELKRQISIRPVMSGSKPDGLMAYRILPDSVFYNLGLRNGDIIKKVNGVAVTSIQDGLDIYKKSTPADPLKILVLRKGETVELIYHITPDKNPDTKRRNI